MMAAAGGFAGIAIVVVLWTVAMTVRAYPALPSRVAVQFDGYGYPRGSAPRPMIFLVSAIHAITLAILFGVMTNAPSVRGGYPGVVAAAIIIDAVILTTAVMQRKILAFNTSAAKRMPAPLRPVLITLAGIAVGLAVQFALK